MRLRTLLTIRCAVLIAEVLFPCSAPTPAGATVDFDFEQRYLVVPGRYMKDRAFVKRGDEWHCFYIVGSDTLPGWQNPGNEITFGHASTKDFRRWTIHPDVLRTCTGAWDERNIWAPDILYRDGRYLMYYTGVDSQIVQQMGVAESTDLFDWTPSPLNPVYRPDTGWADWRPGRWSNCRDPDVFMIGDTLHVLNTASTKDGRGAVAHAVSTDGVTWLDRGPLAINDSDAVLESVQLIEHGGLWHLFFSEYGVLGVSVIRANSFQGPWSKEHRRVISLGQAAEIFGDEPNTLISRHKNYRDGENLRSVVTVDSLFWDANGDPVIGGDQALWENWSPLRLDDPDPLFDETGFEIFETDSAFAYQPTFGENPRFRGEAVTVGVVGNSWIGTRERYTGPLTATVEGGTVGDAAVGGIRSRDFRLTGTEISFLIGGDVDPENLYLALRDATSHATLRRETGAGVEQLECRRWETASLYGRLVYLAIVDASANGHINLDEIVERGGHIPPADLPFPGYVFCPYPNPFRDEITLSLRIDRPARLTVELFDAAGTRIGSLFTGRARIGFLDLSRDGAGGLLTAVAPGVYFVRFESDGYVRSRKIVKID